MKTNRIKVNPGRLNFPTATAYVGRLSSAVFEIYGDIPDDIDTIAVEIERTKDPQTQQPRANFTAAATRQADGSFTCYFAPWYFPDLGAGLHYHIMGLDLSGNPRWLGTGALIITANPSDGSSVTPEIIPADTYIRNPVTGLYHKLTAAVNEYGELRIDLESEGIQR